MIYNEENLIKKDDITFAMDVLAQQRLLLDNPSSPLALKLKRVVKTLNVIRGGKPIPEYETDEADYIRFRICQEIDEEQTMQLLKDALSDEEDDLRDRILSDEDTVSSILHRYGKCESNEHDNMLYAIGCVVGNGSDDDDNY